VALIYLTYFYGIQQMGMKDRSSIDIINPTYIALTTTAIDQCPSVRNLGEVRALVQFGLGGGV
jgi:hypothetical protein